MSAKNNAIFENKKQVVLILELYEKVALEKIKNKPVWRLEGRIYTASSYASYTITQYTYF